MAVHLWGDPKAERAVVCVHGLTRNGRDFDTLAGALADRGCLVVCPDIVGRGESAWLPSAEGYGYPQYIADVTVLLAWLGRDDVDWVGTSMGGLIGMMLAADRDNPIRRLVINDVGPFIPEAALERLAGYVGKDPVFATVDEAESYFRDTYAEFGALTAAQWHQLTQTSLREVDGGYRPHYDPKIGDAMRAGALEDVDLWPLWELVDSDTLVLRGDQSDLLLADTAMKMSETGPKAQVVEIAGCGHAPALMDPGQVEAVTTFLTS